MTVIVQRYRTRPRYADITEPVTEDNWRDFVLFSPFIKPFSPPELDVDVASMPGVLMAKSLHGWVPVQLGNSIVLQDDEAYPITADELEIRYILEHDVDA